MDEPGPTPWSLAALIAARAAEAPDAVAVAAPGRSPLTYRGLAGHCERVRDALRGAGIGADGRVAVLLPNGPELASAFLAVASTAGCAPLNPAYREAELDFFLTDLRPDALILEEGAHTPALEVARRLSVPTITLAPLRSGATGLFDLDVGTPIGASNGSSPGPEDIALLLHTSGTTSRPKLVPLAHRNLCASAGSVARVLELSADDRCLNVMPLFHVHGLIAAVLASISAGSAVVCSPGLDPDAFFGWLEQEHASWYTAVPTMHQAILARAGSHRTAVDRAGLRFVRSSSAALPLRVLADLEELFACPAVEAYGMTEAAHQMTSNPLPPGLRKPGSVGLPAGVELAILDAAGVELSAGSVGEVAVRGPGVFSGYVENPEADSEAFTNGWFRTGDLGVLDVDGYLFLQGRLKEVINRGGEKISPREVDEILLDHPAVAEAVTFGLPHVRLGEEVAAAVVLREGAAAGEADLQRFAAGRLADFKVPRKVVFLDELPKGATGKVQRVGLAELLGLDAGGPGRVRAGYVAPRTPLEHELAARFEELLDLGRPVGATDDFFDLGGDSIAAMELLTWIAEAGLGPAELPASTLLWAPTVERLAEAVEGRREPPDGPIIEITAGGTKAPLYFVHPHDGDVFAFGSLARRLTSNHPFHGIGAEQDPGPKSVEGLAHAYVEAVRAAQPHGPYYLGGRCMGGAIALEMARELTGRGQQVALVALVDPVGEPRNVVRYYWRRFRYFRERKLVLQRLVALRLIRREFERERQLRRATEPPPVASRRLARDAYVACPYRGRIALLRGDYYLTPPSFWERIAAQGVDTYPPFRSSPAERAAAELAEQLDRALGEADARVGGAGASASPARGDILYVEPRTPLERRLASIFAELLGVEPIGAEDDFFELGGDSPAAATLFALLEEEELLPPGLDAAVLLWAPTVERLALALEDDAWSPPAGAVVSLGSSGSSLPFFFVHPHDGKLLRYGLLSRTMRSGHPFTAIRPHAGRAPGREVTIESLAREYAAEIKAAQPHGPYYLGGHCMGGAIALEIARELTDAGEQVAALVLLDPGGEHPSVLRRAWRRAGGYWRRFQFLRRRRRLVRGLVRFSRLQAGNAARRVLTDSARARELRMLASASARYEARPYGGRISLHRHPCYGTSVAFWQRTAVGGLDVRAVLPMGMLRAPNVGVLAAQLDEALREADERLDGTKAAARLPSADVDDEDRDGAAAEGARSLPQVNRGEPDLAEAVTEEDGTVWPAIEPELDGGRRRDVR